MSKDGILPVLPKMTNEEWKSLEQKVAERKALVSKFAKFTKEIAMGLGRSTTVSQGSCHTHVRWFLGNFRGFSFLFDTGQSMMGGEDVVIWYHPDTTEIDPDKMEPVFKFHNPFDSISEMREVKIFDTKVDWVSALKRVITRKKEIMRKMESKKVKEKKGQQQKETESLRKEALLADMKKLGL